MTLLSCLFQLWKLSQIFRMEPPSNAISSTMQLSNRNYSLHMFLSSIKLKVPPPAPASILVSSTKTSFDPWFGPLGSSDLLPVGITQGASDFLIGRRYVFCPFAFLHSDGDSSSPFRGDLGGVGRCFLRSGFPFNHGDWGML
jgi:hypothetical protein